MCTCVGFEGFLCDDYYKSFDDTCLFYSIGLSPRSDEDVYKDNSCPLLFILARTSGSAPVASAAKWGGLRQDGHPAEKCSQLMMQNTNNQGSYAAISRHVCLEIPDLMEVTDLLRVGVSVTIWCNNNVTWLERPKDD